MSSTTDLDTLVINYLTQAQYESAKSGGTIDPDQIYLTPAQGTGVTDVEVDGSSVVTGGVAEVDLSGKADVSHTHTKSQITDFPTIPTVNNATLTIQKNGTTVNTFTANASSNVTANITVPTDTGDLTNGAGYITGYTETDPVFSASASSGITTTDISNWNNGKLSLDTSAQAGTTDGDLYSAIVALGWENDVIE